MRDLYSIVVPVYNSTHSLLSLAERIDHLFVERLKKDYEIIFIDDASPNPQTWKILEQLSEKYLKITSIRLMRNFGQQAATLCGLKEAKGRFMITMDDDLQHDPDDIRKLIMKSSHDIVIAQFKEKKHTVAKRVTSAIKGWFDSLILGKPGDLNLSSFRLLKKEVVEAMLTIATPYPFMPALMFYVTKDVVGVEVGHYHRYEGASGYSFWTLIRLFSNLLINNSSLLLRFVGIVGGIFSCLSIFSIIYFISKKIFFGISVPGWTSVIVLVLFFGGATLFSVGVIGEYLIRIIRGVEKKPSYFIRSIKKN